MADRITWQNVAAPDLRVALAGSVAAADQLAKGFSNLGTTFKGVNDQNITDESNAAMMEAMKIQDPDAWNKMMATTGIAGLGVGPGRASAELMQFAEGYGANLDARRAAVDATNAAADTARAADQRFNMNATANDRLLVTNAQADRASDFDYNTAVTAADRLEVTNAQDDTDFNRTVTLAKRADDIYNKSLNDAAKIQESQMAEQKLMALPASEAARVRAMAEDGTIYQFLGISQDMVTPELQALIYGRDEALTAAGRDEVTSKLAFDATQRTEDDRQLDERAAQIVAELSTSGVSSAADLAILADQYVNNLGGNNPRLMQAVLKALPNVNPAQFATSTEAGQAAQSTPEYVIATRGLESERNRFISANSTSPAMQAYVDGLTSFGSGENPVMGFIDEATTKISKTTPEGEPNAIYNETSASIQGTFNRLKANHAGVPDATIVSLMKRMVQGDGWIGDGDQLELMESQVSKTLDGMSTPEALANFERERSRVDTTLKGYENQQAAMDSLVAKIGLYETQGFTDKAEEAKAELLALTGALAPTKKGDATAGDPRTGDYSTDNPPADPAAAAGAGDPPPPPVVKDTEDSRMQMALDARAGRVNPAVASLADANQTVGETILNLPGRVNDRVAGGALGYLNKGVGWAAEGAGYAAGLVGAPEFGSSMINWAQDYRQSQDDIIQNGLIGETITETTARAQAEATASANALLRQQAMETDVEVARASQDPVTTFEAVSGALGLDYAPESELGQAVDALKTGVDPTNKKPMTKAGTEKYQQVLIKRLKAAGSKYKPNGPNDLMGKLIGNPSAWIK